MKKSKEIIVPKYAFSWKSGKNTLVLPWKSGRNHLFLSWKKGNAFFKYQFHSRILPIPAKNTIFASEIGAKTCR